jgi:hypothetical protein
MEEHEKTNENLSLNLSQNTSRDASHISINNSIATASSSNFVVNNNNNFNIETENPKTNTLKRKSNAISNDLNSEEIVLRRSSRNTNRVDYDETN